MIALFVEKPDFRLGATKVLIVTGGPQQTDIIDIKDPSFFSQHKILHIISGIDSTFTCERKVSSCIQFGETWKYCRFNINVCIKTGF